APPDWRTKVKPKEIARALVHTTYCAHTRVAMKERRKVLMDRSRICRPLQPRGVPRNVLIAAGQRPGGRRVERRGLARAEGGTAIGLAVVIAGRRPRLPARRVVGWPVWRFPGTIRVAPGRELAA